MAVEPMGKLSGVRERMLPMLRFAAGEYQERASAGYPVLIDGVETGAIGIELDPSHALYVVEEGEQLFADFYYRSSRTDARSSASREKFSGAPFNDRRPLAADASDQTLRNLIAELMSRWNIQPGIIHITDS